MEVKKMNKIEIENEIRRLAPWYYLYDIHGVRTDITPPFDEFGHRQVDTPHELLPYLKGKSVLDVGCNEGKRGFEALKSGAASVIGFDCRQMNIDKARFVAKSLEIDNAAFAVGSADAWPNTPQHDVVFLCGLLYHLPRPWETVAKYCAIARETIFVTSVLQGGNNGYTPWMEGETIGASEKTTEASMMPNTIETVTQEFAKHGFKAVFQKVHEFGPPIALLERIRRRFNPSRGALKNLGGLLILRRSI
jgi:2-polyprenyl-3-methyl-5-hydroxy-6-metoxy-1,4-benzoquinol methylase